MHSHPILCVCVAGRRHRCMVLAPPPLHRVPSCFPFAAAANCLHSTASLHCKCAKAHSLAWFALLCCAVFFGRNESALPGVWQVAPPSGSAGMHLLQSARFCVSSRRLLDRYTGLLCRRCRRCFACIARTQGALCTICLLLKLITPIVPGIKAQASATMLPLVAANHHTQHSCCCLSQGYAWCGRCGEGATVGRQSSRQSVGRPARLCVCVWMKILLLACCCGVSSPSLQVQCARVCVCLCV